MSRTLDSKIIILLATFNRAHLLRETLESIINQTHKNWVCIIIDDFSCDNTYDVVDQYRKKDLRFTYYKKPSHYKKGLSASRNYGLDLAKNHQPDFLQFFDDDDIMHPRKLELQIENLEANFNADFCLCGAKNFKKISEIEGKEIYDFPELKKLSIGEAYLTGKINFVAQVPLFRYSYAKNFEFDEDLFYAEEWTLFSMQFLLKNPQFTLIDKVLFYRRKHPVSITESEDSDFSKRKTSAITGIKIFNFLDQNKAHTKITLLYFLRQFLIYKYESEILFRIRQLIKQYYPGLFFRYKLAKATHWLNRKIILRILKI